MNGAMLCVFLGIWLLSVTENFNHPLLPMAVLISVVECAIAQVHQGALWLMGNVGRLLLFPLTKGLRSNPVPVNTRITSWCSCARFSRVFTSE